jgi:hypothetical protein
LRTASWFPKSVGRLGKTEKAIKFCHDANCAQPNAAILVELGEQTKFKVFNVGTANLTGFFELSDRARQGWDSPAGESLQNIRADGDNELANKPWFHRS